MPQLSIIPRSEFDRVRQEVPDPFAGLPLLADMCRANALTAVKKAGSGHLGSSFSAMDIFCYMLFHKLNTVEKGFNNPDRDIFFSSKGHDAPGYYTVLAALGVIPEEKLLLLRRLGGLDGHPHVSIPGMEANTGSLGMGISKGKGMALAKRFNGHGGQVYVMTGDGEFQEGQIYEALQSSAHLKVGNLNVIVDHNKVQTDRLVEQVGNLRDIEAKVKLFGWHVIRCNGHNFKQLDAAFREMETITDRPKMLIADTIKGRGVSFMEHPADIAGNNGLYRWHSGAPDDVSFEKAFAELKQQVIGRATALQIKGLVFRDLPQEEKPASAAAREYVADAFGHALVDLGKKRQDLVVLSADLSADCRTRDFERTYPDRFFEIGIAEQDMVSTAGGLAKQGLLPVVNSFASFLASRANEHIYNNSGEKTKIIYACHYSGVIPAGPGLSHQSIRDISLFGALPNMEIIQPGNSEEMRMAVEYCVETAKDNCMLRLIIGPSPRKITMPAGYVLQKGRGVALTTGKDAVLFAYGPVMLNEALTAAELLAPKGVGLKVVNMPWLNRIDPNWLRQVLAGQKKAFVLEDHAPVGGLGDRLLRVMVQEGISPLPEFRVFGIEGYPAWGTPPEVLDYHNVSGQKIAQRICS
jgi:transketolase